jgi:acylphosphatase
MHDPSPPDAVPQRDLHVIVTGRVQGVGFRETMIAVAHDLGVTGWVRNCRDGSVEAVIRAASVPRAAMLAWLGRGPPGARVERLVQREATDSEMAQVQAGFRRLPSG